MGLNSGFKGLIFSIRNYGSHLSIDPPFLLHPLRDTINQVLTEFACNELDIP